MASQTESAAGRAGRHGQSAVRWMVGLLVAALLWGGTVPVAVAAPEPSWASAEELDAFLRERVDELRLPGLAVVVVADGEVRFEGTYGEARPGVAVTLDTPFLLGSTSKQLTALAVQQLIADGGLALDTPVGDLHPAFAAAGPPHSEITVGHLLAHRSGLAEEGLEWSPWPGSQTLQEEARRLAGLPLRTTPGAAYAYVNSGYTVLGAIVEQVTGMPFVEALQTLVFEPLGLTATTGDLEAARDNGLAAPHYTWFRRVNAPTPSPMAPYAGPAALLTSTAHDLTTLVRAHLGTSTGMDPEVLRAAREPLGAVDEHTDYASGWLVRGLWELTDDDVGWDSPDRPTLWEHEGSIPRALSSLSFSPDLGLGVVALTNTGAGTDQASWWRFRYDLHHAILGTRGLPHEPDLLVAAAPLLMLGLPIAQAGTLVWWAVTRRRRPGGLIALAAAGATAALALVFAFGLVPPRTGRPLFDQRWVAVVPDLAVAVAVMLALSLVLIVSAVGAAVRGRTRSRGVARV